ncbi:zinc finger SWIM domain-containing protein 3 [Bombina bombina]|uniref:zinc finger SWIM domain-containing protein 3 n=1 Tax=Bombina bombina TaxID=8345 RepID=UPI00235B1B95|nr:zinc finger SWIM domain-containing protein 3 [Bombina bombina]
MQLGSCFINYEDFKENLKIYRRETKNSYSIQSSISVRYHNTKHGKNLRQDITFVHAKFCCSQLQNHKRKSNIVCPAFFVVQYNEDLDRLVIIEENSNHIHTEEYKKTIPSMQVSRKPNNPSKKFCSYSQSPVLPDDGAVKGYPLSENVLHSQHNFSFKEETLPDTQYVESLNKEAPSVSTLYIKEGAVSLEQVNPSEILNGNASDAIIAPLEFSLTDMNPPQEPIAATPTMNVATLVNHFLLKDVGSKATMCIGSQSQLERLSFQTNTMRSIFLKFPESLLLHRVTSKNSYILYAFLVENKDRVSKIVHFCFLKEDNTESVSKMISAFQSFNPEWSKVKVIFTEVFFLHKAVLKETFPSAQVLLSMYHTVRLIESKAKVNAPANAVLKRSLENVIYKTSPDNVLDLADKLQHRLDKELYNFLNTNWFPCELHWYMHVKKGLHSCSTYMHSLDQITKKISSLFEKQISIEPAIQQFVQYADCLNSKTLENMGHTYPGFSKSTKKKSKTIDQPLETTEKIRLPRKRFIPIVSKLSEPKQSMSPSTKFERQPSCPEPAIGQAFALPPNVNIQPFNVSDTIEQSLQKHLNALGYSLCLKEWQLVQKSAQLVNVQENNIAVQLLEESHHVSADGCCCTCYFNSCYKLPCRHILSMLNANNKPVEEAMVCRRWQKKYFQERMLLEEEFQNSLLHFSSSEDEARNRGNKIKSLTTELSHLLLQCTDSELLKVRLSNLQIIVDMWRKEPEPNKEQCLSPKSSIELPYQWVKKEHVDGEENFDCHELLRVDTHQTQS